MDKDDALKWARRNKKAFARKLIADAGVERSQHPVAFFMAGLPGSGKTEFTKSLIKNLNVKILRLDMDEIAAQIDTYTPQKADRFRAGASMLLSRTFDMVVDRGYDFIMDGTFGSAAVLQDLKRAIKSGYTIKIVYIYQDPKVAWEYTVAREKVEHRAIDFESFVESYYRIFDNLKNLNLAKESVSVDLVVKDEQNKVQKIQENIITKDIDKYVKIEYNKDKLRSQIHE